LILESLPFSRKSISIFKDEEEQKRAFWIISLLILTALTVFFGAIRAMYAMQKFTDSSEKIHNVTLQRLLFSPIHVFDNTPIGRILNLFSKDVGFADDLLPRTMFDFLQTLFIVLGTTVLTVIANFLVLFVLIPLTGYFFNLRKYFLTSSREIKRLEAISR